MTNSQVVEATSSPVQYQRYTMDVHARTTSVVHTDHLWQHHGLDVLRRVALAIDREESVLVVVVLHDRVALETRIVAQELLELLRPCQVAIAAATAAYVVATQRISVLHRVVLVDQ